MNISIAEPTTMLTNYLISVETFIFARLLFRLGSQQKSLRLWATAFITIGVAAFLGGTYHGFAIYLQESTSMILWMNDLSHLISMLAFYLFFRSCYLYKER